MNDRRAVYAAVFLMFFSSFIELSTGNIPLRMVVSPLYLFLFLHYGVCSVLIREAIARWNQGFASTLILGAAYGIFNESITSGGFFDPAYYSVVDLGLAGFGRWGGVNVVWAVGLTLFHMIFSIAVPIVLTDALFPGTRGRLSNKTLVAGAALLAVAFGLIRFAMRRMHAYQAGWTEWWMVVVIMITLVFLARRLPPIALTQWDVRPHPFLLFACGFAGDFLFFFAQTGFRKAVVPDPALNIFFLLALVAFYGWLLLKLPEPPIRSKVALAAGIYSMPILASLFAGRLIQAAIGVLVLAAAWIKTGEARHAGAVSLELES